MRKTFVLVIALSLSGALRLQASEPVEGFDLAALARAADALVSFTLVEKTYTVAAERPVIGHRIRIDRVFLDRTASLEEGVELVISSPGGLTRDRGRTVEFRGLGTPALVTGHRYLTFLQFAAGAREMRFASPDLGFFRIGEEETVLTLEGAAVLGSDHGKLRIAPSAVSRRKSDEEQAPAGTVSDTAGRVTAVQPGGPVAAEDSAAAALSLEAFARQLVGLAESRQ